jgi:hypothetical protein
MIKQLALVLTFSAALVTASIAQTAAPAPAPAPAAEAAAATPATPDDCIKAAFELAQKAEDKKMSNDELDKLEQMLSKMENFCDAKQFTEAMAVSKDIKAVIDTKQ